MLIREDGGEACSSTRSGRADSARPELVEEYYDIVGERTHFCSVAGLLEMASETTEEDVDLQSIIEVQMLAESDRSAAPNSVCAGQTRSR